MDPAYRPFCSKRCADVDLNRWLTGAYVIPGGKHEEGDGERDEADSQDTWHEDDPEG
jgi:endogenous inhibitor of DNA gyrase (YacG/DUF329 family)